MGNMDGGWVIWVGQGKWLDYKNGDGNVCLCVWCVSGLFLKWREDTYNGGSGFRYEMGVGGGGVILLCQLCFRYISACLKLLPGNSQT